MTYAPTDTLAHETDGRENFGCDVRIPSRRRLSSRGLRHAAELPDDDAFFTIDEVREQVAAFCPEDHSRLHLAAHRLSSRAGLLAEDLAQDALLRILRGSRRCRRAVPLLVTLFGTMRSLCSAEIEAREGRARDLPPAGIERFPDQRPTPERLAISSIDGGRLLGQVTDAIEDDGELLRLAEALVDGLFGAALLDHLGLNATELATVRRRLKRRLAHLAGDFSSI